MDLFRQHFFLTLVWARNFLVMTVDSGVKIWVKEMLMSCSPWLSIFKKNKNWHNLTTRFFSSFKPLCGVRLITASVWPA